MPKLTITHLDHDARGAAPHEGYTVLIPGAAPGDVVEALITARSQHQPTAYATLTAVIKRGQAFVDPPCPHAAPLNGRCGGCPAMHLTPDAQRDLKLALVLDALAAARIADALPAPAWHPAPQALGYRNRSHFVAARDADARPVLGAYAPRSHDVVPQQGCVIVRPAIDAAQQAICALLATHHIPIYPEPSGLRHVTLRADNAGRWLVDLVVTSHKPAWLDALVAEIMALSGAAGVAYSVHDQDSNAIRVAASTHLAGAAALPERLATQPALTVELAADGFFQLHTEVAGTMYSRAAALADQPGVIWDLYCGVGGLGLTVAMRHGARLCGAESHPDSIARAAQHAAQHNIDATFAVCDLAQTTPDGWPAPDLILVNPPRRGLDARVLDLARTTTARQLVYMSCGPQSFARDAAALIKAGWRCNTLEAHDMLPQTTHVELLSLWSRS
jgi:23S rRNA (uracil1939-C5)-methyltransferase